jgi:hypothetical protein
MTVAPVNVLKYLRADSVSAAQSFHLEYYKDLISSYGVTAKYLRQDSTFPNDLREQYSNLIYDENYSSYNTSAELPIYLEATADAFIMSKYGIEPDQHYRMFCTIKDFEFAFASLAQQQVVSTTVPFNISVSAYSGVVSALYNSPDTFLSGVISGTIIPSASGIVSGVALSQYHNYSDDILVNPMIALPNAWDYVKATFSSFHGPYAGFLNASGTGSVSGTLSGIVVYKRLGAFEPNKYQNITPLPDDFFEIPFSDDNKEQYTITNVIDRDLMPNGINPLLQKYIFACEIVRRTYSQETGLLSGETKNNSDMIDIEKQTEEYLSDKLFDYNLQAAGVDAAKSDRIYGSFGNTVSSLPNSQNLYNITAVSAQSVSGIIFNFDLGGRLFTDSIHLYFSTDALITGNSLDVSGFTCSVSAISGYTPVNYLITDTKNLYFVNILSASAMVNKTPFESNSYLLEEIDLSKPQAMLTAQVSGGVAMEINDTQLYSNGSTLYFINNDEESVVLI